MGKPSPFVGPPTIKSLSGRKVMTELEAKALGAKLYREGWTMAYTSEFQSASNMERGWMVRGWLDEQNRVRQKKVYLKFGTFEPADLLPMPPGEGPPLPRGLGISWSPKQLYCPQCKQVQPARYVSHQYQCTACGYYPMTASWTEKPGEETVGSQILKTMVTKTIDDITYDEMNRVVKRLARMSKEDRDAPARVAKVIGEELTPEKAMTYIDKALANGSIKSRDYDQMRAVLLLGIPRERVTLPMGKFRGEELLEFQKGLRREFGSLPEQSKEKLRRSFGELDTEVARLRKAWGL